MQSKTKLDIIFYFILIIFLLVICIQIFNHIPTEIRTANQKIDKVEEKIDKVEEKIDKLEVEIKELNKKIDDNYKEQQKINIEILSSLARIEGALLGCR